MVVWELSFSSSLILLGFLPLVHALEVVEEVLKAREAILLLEGEPPLPFLPDQMADGVEALSLDLF